MLSGIIGVAYDQGHITSLKPLRPENGPDEWERKALLSFEQGETKAYEVVEENGQRFARLMQPMEVTQGCMKCHAHQGYVLGDVRGGVSVRVPMAPFLPADKAQMAVEVVLTHIKGKFPALSGQIDSLVAGGGAAKGLGGIAGGLGGMLGGDQK